MAITESKTPQDPFQRPRQLACGIIGCLLGTALIVGLGIHLFIGGNLDSRIVLLHLLWMGLGALSAAGGWSLLRGRIAGLWTLLALYLVLAAGAVVQGFAWLLWGVDGLLPGLVREQPVLMILLPLLAGAGVSALGIGATMPRTRSRYGAVVSVTAATVLTVVVVFNMAAQANSMEIDFEQLGRFGLSERSRRIVRDVQQPVYISAVYTDASIPAETDAQRKIRNQAEERLERVMELLEEIHRANETIAIRNASGEAARAELMDRLRSRQIGSVAEHDQLLEEMQDAVEPIRRALDQAAQQWQTIPRDSYLNQWRLRSIIPEQCNELSRRLQETSQQVRRKHQVNPLADPVASVQTLGGTMRETTQWLGSLQEDLDTLAGLPAAVEKNAPATRANFQRAVEATNGLVDAIGRVGDNPPEDPAEAIKHLVVASGLASSRIQTAADALGTLGGDSKRATDFLTSAGSMGLTVETGLGQVPIPMTSLMQQLVTGLDDIRARAAMLSGQQDPAVLRRLVVQARQSMEDVAAQMQAIHAQFERGLAALRQIDPASETFLDGPNPGFAQVRQQIEPLLTRADELPEPQEAPLPDELGQKNIIVIEGPESVYVATFEDVWPRTMPSGNPAAVATHDESPRFFNGDTALASRLLKIVHPEPFARVLLTHYSPQLSPQLMQLGMRPPEGPIAPNDLSTLRDRLTDANFLVEEWNLTEEFPAADVDFGGDNGTPTDSDSPDAEQAESNTDAEDSPEKEPLPTILVVLPPPPPVPDPRTGMPMTDPQTGKPMGQFGQVEITHLRRAVNRGASAIFLAQSMPPQPGFRGASQEYPYPLNDYLRSDWGIDIRTSYTVIQGTPAAGKPGEYQLDLIAILSMPLSTFSDHPIGKPLRGRRMYWPLLCPVSILPDGPTGVESQPILQIPGTSRNVWATGDFYELYTTLEQTESGTIRPDFESGDLKPPLDIVVAATRAGEEEGNIKPSRLVAMGLGMGLTDMYVAEPLRTINAEGGYETAPPPRENLDLMVNTAYWLVGREPFIATGPSRIEPVAAMSNLERHLLWAMCVFGLPLAVGAIGLAVLIMRSR